MTRALRNLNFLLRRHRQTGADYDYLTKLTSEQLSWLEQFTRRYYNAENEADPVLRKEANRRRYSAKNADAMRIARSYENLDTNNIDDLDPEKLVLLAEGRANPPRHLRSVVRGSDETK
jgi:hypothetical protein